MHFCRIYSYLFCIFKKASAHIRRMDYLSYGYALAITLGGVIGYVKAGIKVDVHSEQRSLL